MYALLRLYYLLFLHHVAPIVAPDNYRLLLVGAPKRIICKVLLYGNGQRSLHILATSYPNPGTCHLLLDIGWPRLVWCSHLSSKQTSLRQAVYRMTAFLSALRISKTVSLLGQQGLIAVAVPVGGAFLTWAQRNDPPWHWLATAWFKVKVNRVFEVLMKIDKKTRMV